MRCCPQVRSGRAGPPPGQGLKPHWGDMYHCREAGLCPTHVKGGWGPWAESGALWWGTLEGLVSVLPEGLWQDQQPKEPRLVIDLLEEGHQ